MASSPTVGNFNIFLNNLFTKEFLSADDNLWFFFAGHGCHRNSKDYLILEDADAAVPEKSCLEVQYLADTFCKSGAGNVIMFIDACRTARGNASIQPGKQQGVIIFYACMAGEEAQELCELKAGVFTSALLAGLQEEDCATVAWLENYLKQKVPKLARSQVQNPVLALNSATEKDTLLFPNNAKLAHIEKLKNNAESYLETSNFENAEKLLIQALNACIMSNLGEYSDIINAIKKIEKARLDHERNVEYSELIEKAKNLRIESIRSRNPGEAKDLIIKALAILLESSGMKELLKEQHSLIQEFKKLLEKTCEEPPLSRTLDHLQREAQLCEREGRIKEAIDSQIRILKESPGNQLAIRKLLMYGASIVTAEFERWLSLPSEAGLFHSYLGSDMLVN